MAGQTRITKNSWPFRSTVPNASESFDINGLRAQVVALDELSRWVQDAEPDAPVEGDLWSDTASRKLRAYFGAKWVALNIGSVYDVGNYGMAGVPGEDYTDEWVALLHSVVDESGGNARIVFGEGTFGIGPYMPVAGLGKVLIQGAGDDFTTISALPGTTNAMAPSTETAVYAASPLRFDGLTRLLIRDCTVDCQPATDWAVTQGYVSLLYDNTLHPTYHGAQIGDTQLKVWDSSHVSAGKVLVFGTVEGESGTFEYTTVESVPDINTVNLSAPLTKNWPVASVDSATFAVERTVAAGGVGIDARNTARVTLTNVHVAHTLRGGVEYDTVPYCELYDSHVEQVGMAGGFGHTKEYPFASQLMGSVGGYSVSKFLMDRCVIEEGSNHAVMLRVKPSSVDFTEVGRPTVNPAWDVRVTATLILNHGTFTYVKGNGSGINLISNRDDAKLGRVMIDHCGIYNVVDGPIWILATDGHIILDHNEIDTAYGPAIACGGPLYAITDNTIRNASYSSILVQNTARTGDYVDRYGNSIDDGVITGNVLVNSGRQGIILGSSQTGRPLNGGRRIVCANNVITNTALEAIFAEEMDGTLILGPNIIRNSNRLYTATMTLSAPAPTAPDGPTTGPWTTVHVTAVPALVEGNYFKFSADGTQKAYRIVTVDRVANTVRLDATPPTAFTGTLLAAFPAVGALKVEGRRPFSTTVTATGTTVVGGVTYATVTVASTGDASPNVGLGIGIWDRLTFGTDAAVYQVTAPNPVVANVAATLTLDRNWDAAPPANGTVARRSNVYPQRNIQIVGGFIGDEEDAPLGTKSGVYLERCGGNILVAGVQFGRVREAGVDILDTTPRGNGVSGTIRDNTFRNVGVDTSATATRRAGIYIKSTDNIASNFGWVIEDNRLVDDQVDASQAPVTPTVQYGLVLEGWGVGGGEARRNDFRAAQARAFGVAGAGVTNALYQLWDREGNQYPPYSPNNDDMVLVEEWPGSATASGQLGTHGWATAGSIGKMAPNASQSLAGAAIVSNAGATSGYAALAPPTLGWVDSGEGWDVEGIFCANTADGSYRVGAIDDPSLAFSPAIIDPQFGAYFERLSTGAGAGDANWFLVCNNRSGAGGTKIRVDTGVAFVGTGAMYVGRIRHYLSNGNPVVRWSLARAYGASGFGSGVVTGTNVPEAGHALNVVAMQSGDPWGGTPQPMQGRNERMLYRQHGISRL